MKNRPLEVIALHGWASDATCWNPWREATLRNGWRWQTGERGYGHLPPRTPAWQPQPPPGTKRLVIGHSLGPHLAPPHVWAHADVAVLLASFAAFVPPDRTGRRTRAALRGMASCLADKNRARAMLTDFLTKAAAPQPLDLMPPGPMADRLTEINLARLREDLVLLEHCDGLPEGFPRSARVLIVEPEDDHIVEPTSRALLRATLPEAEVMRIPETGHALLTRGLIDRVVSWVENWL